METGAITAAAAGGAAVALVIGVAAIVRRRRQTRHELEAAVNRMATHLVAPVQGDVITGETTARFRVTFADGTTTEVEADSWRSGAHFDQIMLLHHVIDLTGGHQEVVAEFSDVKAIQRVDD